MLADKAGKYLLSGNRLSKGSGVPMKEQIFKYLLDAGRGVAAAKVLEDVLNIRSPNSQTSNNVLAGILGQDSRFTFNGGLWHLSSHPGEPVKSDLSRAAVLHLKSPNLANKLQASFGAIRQPDGRIEEFTARTPINIFGKMRLSIAGQLLIVWSSRELRLWNAFLQVKGLETWHGERLYLQNLAARVLKRTPSKIQAVELASELGLSPPDEENLREIIQYLSACWLLLLERVPSEHCRNIHSLQEWIDSPGTAVDFSHFAFGRGFLQQLPSASGVYIMKNREGTILYIGKSSNLKRRVSSYFTQRAPCNPKITKIHTQLHSIEICATDNEIEALLLEMRLIKDFRPAINLQTEIHERQVDRHAGRNLLLFVVDEKQKGVRIYFLRNGIFPGRCAASLGGLPSKRLKQKLKSIFFTRSRRRRQGEIWEKEIVSRWFAANQRRLNYLDVDDMKGFAAVLERLRNYLCDPDKLMHKVYYR
jgi:hypothetical protein